MLKSYEAVYQNGQLHWVGARPPKEIEHQHVMVIVDLDKLDAQPTKNIRRLIENSRACVKPLMDIDEIDASVLKMRSEWDREWNQ